ncbi:cytochrome c biogenesis protein ResB [Sutcliffiella sp. NC1]|uniref:cytochrome c biogenesis protein ResB n=1 Tax=Sutcliffiella sp. NC1 TaxID=3004096 RepID=UPI0022DDF483|nr:cytochrome c biogenesis protein ResB [Sutcliffiella sp. NC1]WBL13525.1 cytochrome c biogenesis protein ResB [Sutcliffiella sp. NC1]
MNEMKCECGHVNPHGTILCEACGKPTENEKTKTKLLDMTYEGSARRSQTYNKTIVDKIWNFFSSVKVGVWLIVITLIASSFGTIFPQEMYIPPTMAASEYYEMEHGFFGKLYYTLGFHNLYSSWWYLILVASIGISLVICSLDRVIPLYKALKNQRVTRHDSFLTRQRVFGKTTVEIHDDEIAIVKEGLKKRGYNIREENGNILAEKGRFSRWGPYVNHIGLIIFLAAAILRSVPGMYLDEVLWVREGELLSIPGTDGQYYLENESFLLEVYDSESTDEVFNQAIERAGNGMLVSNYQTNAVLYERVGDIVHGAEPELSVVKEHAIRVNEPLKHDSFGIYQVDFKLNEFKTMSFNLLNKETNENFGTITVDLTKPETLYDLGDGYSVQIVNYFPDFFLNEGEPGTRTRVPNNPAFVFRMITPDKPKGEISLVAIQQNLEPEGNNEYRMAFAGLETRNAAGLTVRVDHTLWIFGLGGTIFMIGVIQGMYWNHRRVWVKRNGNEVWLAAHTNKNWFGLKKDISKALEHSKISIPIDQTEEEKNSENDKT